MLRPGLQVLATSKQGHQCGTCNVYSHMANISTWLIRIHNVRPALLSSYTINKATFTLAKLESDSMYCVSDDEYTEVLN